MLRIRQYKHENFRELLAYKHFYDLAELLNNEKYENSTKTYLDKFNWSLKQPKTICLAYLKAKNPSHSTLGIAEPTLTRIFADKMAISGQTLKKTSVDL
jgi:hypothetical protein